jgi:uncharacterized membrane protein
MLTVLLGLGGALAYGAADFLGGVAARKISPLVVTAGVAVVGLVFILAGTLVVEGVWSQEAWFWGVLSGITGAAAIGLLYACLAMGPMSILSPTTAFLSALLPVSWGLSTGGATSPWLYPALGLAMIAIILVGIVPDHRAVRPTLKSLIMAVASGLLIGTFYVLIDQTPVDSGLTPLVANRLSQTVILFVVIGFLVIRRRTTTAKQSLFGDTGAARAALPVVVGSGLLDALANIAVIIGLRVGDLAVVSVLTALYPAGTILLAAMWLKERVSTVQLTGLGLALIASAMLAS